jgi:c-di-GMP-binding flagellar brake protein YcgR
MAEERRSDDRINIELSARIFNSAGEIVRGEGKIMDIAPGGAKMVTAAGLGVGEIVQLEFLVQKVKQAGKDKLMFTCEVETVWKSGEKEEMKIYGVKFVNLSSISKELILKLVDLMKVKEGR